MQIDTYETPDAIALLQLGPARYRGPAMAGRIPITEPLGAAVFLLCAPPMVWIYLSDACLWCVGLMIAASAARRPGLLLLTLPLVGLSWLFARERHQRIEQTLALSTAYRGTALLLADVVEADDRYTGTHSREVVDLALAVADALGLDALERQSLEFAALLHDVGKIRVPKEIINKPGRLDPGEWQIVREHTIEGERMLRRVGGVLSSVGRFVRSSHERYDGAGYPDGLAGEAIPIQSRIVSVCDAYSAMITDRPYRRAISKREALSELWRCAGSQFDPRIVAAIDRLLRVQPSFGLECDENRGETTAGATPRACDARAALRARPGRSGEAEQREPTR